MSRWAIIAGMGALTYAVRLSMLVFVDQAAVPGRVRDALRFVAPAVLAAIIAPAVVYAGHGGGFSLSFANDRLVAAILAGAVAWTTKNIWLTIAAGMGVLWLLQA